LPGKVTVGLASQWPCVTDCGISIHRFSSHRQEVCTPPTLVGNGVLNRFDRVSECDRWTDRITAVPAVEFDPGVRIVYERNKHADVPPLYILRPRRCVLVTYQLPAMRCDAMVCSGVTHSRPDLISHLLSNRRHIYQPPTQTGDALAVFAAVILPFIERQLLHFV